MRPTTQRMLGVALLVGCAAGVCGGAETPSGSPLSAIAVAAKDRFRPITADEVASRRQLLDSAMKAVEKLLASGDLENAAQLRETVKWETLQAELGRETVDLPALQSIRLLFFAREPGLELPEFREVRDALTHYMDAVYVSSDAKIEAKYRETLDDLAQRLDAYTANPTTEAGLAIGRTVGWLERAGQADEVVAAVRGAYRQPNLYAELSRRMVASGFEQDVTQVETVREDIIGTSIRGTARTNGRVHLKFVPDAERASFDISFLGRATTSNVGYNGPVKIFSTGWTRISARKRIYVDAEGMTSDRAVADCSTSSRIHRVSARCNCVERVAWNRAQRMKSQAEAVASGKAERRVAGQFNRQAATMINKANDQFLSKFRDPLLRRDGFPNHLQFRTTEDQMYVEAMRAGPNQLASAGPPPEIEGHYDMSLRIHDSMVFNVGETLMGDETLTDKSLLKMLEDAGAEIPDELKIGPESEPWSITFARDTPLVVSFAADQITIALLGTRFTRGEQDIPEPVRITAVYQVAGNGEDVRLTRTGDVEVEFVKRRSLSVEFVTKKTFLRRKFGAIFKPEIDPRDLTLPGRWEQTGKIRLAHLQSGGGWLRIGFNQKSQADGEAVASSAN